ncbi:Oxysterol-binding protein-related protein 9 [Tupaia chinensis]|uniref:Oxysterol-binding protein-related protein 9 n=1 Tax=Tupaia chinensis TaxID=246437 RepID=L9KWI0_TUPCH|nr:Oxysterol-binding protein-related protein 9 [Tupaia chinensis]
MASIMEGPLSKWTNVMKGWQYRWFVLDYNAGLLSYYTIECPVQGTHSSDQRETSLTDALTFERREFPTRESLVRERIVRCTLDVMFWCSSSDNWKGVGHKDESEIWLQGEMMRHAHTLFSCKVEVIGALRKGAVIGIDDEDDSTFTITVDQKTFHFQVNNTNAICLCYVSALHAMVHR